MGNTAAISLLLKTASDLKKTQGRDAQIQYLRLVYNEPLRYIIQGALHPGVEWLLPKGQMLFAPSKDPDSTKLYREYKKLYMFCKGGVDALDQHRRENLFIQLLEALHPDDAELMICVKDKYLPYPGVDYDLICGAYPGMLPDNRSKVLEKNDKPDSVVTETPFKTETENITLKVPQKTNKGKTWWNNGIVNFMILKEEALSKGFLPGRLKK